jgi:hypothetical protein
LPFFHQITNNKEQEGGKPPAIEPSSASRKRKATPSTSRSNKKSKFSHVRVVKHKQMPAIDPTFAMMSRKLYKGKNVLAIGQDADTWDFHLHFHLSTIMEKYLYHDFYLVGYRHEERPPIKSINEYIQIHVPFFLLHGLPKGSAQPSRLAISDLELKTLKYYSMVDLPLQWKKLDTVLPAGQEVKMLVSTARTTIRAMASQTNEDVCSGGQFWFAVPIDHKENPGEDFAFDREDDDREVEKFYFGEEPWDETMVELKETLKKDGVGWVEFCRWEKERWLDLLLEVAVNQFFAYEEDLPREQYASEVKELLADTFRSFKEKREAEESLYEEHREVAENSKHFKIYPENECLKAYLSGDCSNISKWCGNAEAVYPQVPPPSVNTVPGNL